MHTQSTPATEQLAPSDQAIEITGLTRGFGSGERRVQAVDGVDLSVRRGEIVALLGPNGAGKTTTIDMLLGLSSPDGGTVRVLGQSPRQAVASGRLSALLQTGGLLSDLTVAETVDVIAGFHSASARVPEVMERTGLTSIAKRKVSKCSGGEQQRIKFALALLPDPDVLVLDEPTTGMDVVARRNFWQAMAEEAGAGRTIVFATHYLEEAEQFAQRTLVMNRGKIVADGATAELRSSLGGRTVTATLPAPIDQSTVGAILDELKRAGLLAGVQASDMQIDSAGVMRVRTAHSDALAAKLLALGAHDLEIVAPTLETAFTTLTQDAGE
ncbi:MAG: ABC transporter ATP-binding protein [Actinobacteria bacterium]|nr:ABC transporter ATP-binding protein [Actinomycetota bacterium]